MFWRGSKIQKRLLLEVNSSRWSVASFDMFLKIPNSIKNTSVSPPDAYVPDVVLTRDEKKQLSHTVIAGDLCRKCKRSRQLRLESTKCLRASLKEEFKVRNGREFGISFGVYSKLGGMKFYQMHVVFLSPERYFVQEIDTIDAQQVDVPEFCYVGKVCIYDIVKAELFS